MLNSIEKSLFVQYRRENRWMLRAVLVVTLAFLPVLIIMAPVPGYVLLNADFNTFGFTITFVSLCLINLVSVNVYHSIFQKQYLAWPLSIKGSTRVFWHYFFLTFKFCVIGNLVLLLGWLKTPVAPDSVLRFACIAISQVGGIGLLTWHYLHRSPYGSSTYAHKHATHLPWVLMTQSMQTAQLELVVFGCLVGVYSSIAMAADSVMVFSYSTVAYVIMQMAVMAKVFRVTYQQHAQMTAFLKSVAVAYYNKQVSYAVYFLGLVSAIALLPVVGWYFSLH